MITAESSRATFVESLRRLRAAQKSAKGAPPYSLFVNRPVGRVFAAAAHPLGLTPNQVTVLSAICTFASLALLVIVPPVGWLGPVVGLGLMIGYALDSADGQLARLRGGGSVSGEWLDHLIDSIKVVAVHLVVLIAWARFEMVWTGLLLVPIGFALVSSVHFFGMILIDLLTRVARAGTGVVMPPPAPSLIKTLAKLPTDYGLLCLLFWAWAVPGVFVIGYSIMAVATAGYLLLVLVKWYGDVRTLDRGATSAQAQQPSSAEAVGPGDQLDDQILQAPS